MTTETITWHPVEQRRPDADITVLVAIELDSSERIAGAGEPVWLGYLDGETWMEIDGMPIRGRVSHWADVPAGPHA